MTDPRTALEAHEFAPMSKRIGSPCQRCGQNSFHPNHAALATPPAPEPSAALVVTAAEDFVRVATEHQSLDYAAPEFVILRDALRRGTSAAARAEGLDGAWAEVERVLPKGAWVNIFPPAFADPSWMAGVVLPNGPFPVSRGANPVEALRNLAAALADRTTEAG